MSISDRIIAWATARKPNLCVGGETNPYMRRWYVIPRNPFLNIYIHQFMRDDEDRACHDHPWWSFSWLMRGLLCEVTDTKIGRLRAHNNRIIFRGEFRFRSATFAHRLVVPHGSRGDTWTLFITGPRLREWGFHCPKGWVHWREFTAGEQGEIVGRGCGDMF